MRSMLPFVALVLLVPVFAGCLDDSKTPATDNMAASTYQHEALDALYEQIPWNATGSWSKPLPEPLYERLDSVIAHVESFDGTDLQLGIFRPDIPGCPTTIDLDQDSYPEECRTPVIMDSGPYFTPNSIGVESTRPPIALWFVPYGYTVVQMSVRGTGGSGGCMEFMSLNEQKDVDHTVTWLGEQPWSTGSVAMMGRSYDGTTPFMAAAMGNPYLKTIVPISGVSDVPDLMFSNGTSEFRGPIMHSYVYWVNYGFGQEPRATWDSQACQELAEGQAVGAYTMTTGDWDSAGLSDYWQERRFREPILENYNGSMFIVHGMQDWNVNPRMVVPWINQLQDAGIETKAWLGQWGHAYPDRSDEHTNTRWDWADATLRWFDRELKGWDVDVGPAIEVEDHRHDWWVMDSYPARNITWKPLFLNRNMTMTSEPADVGDMMLVANPMNQQRVQGASFTSEPIEGPVRVSGLVRMDLEVAPTSPTGANVYAQLYDVYPDGRTEWMGQGWLNLAYHKGGNERQDLVPGQPVVAKFEFEPMEAYIPDGHRIRLVIDHEFRGSNGDGWAKPDGTPFLLHMDGDSVLKLPLVKEFERSPYRDP